MITKKKKTNKKNQVKKKLCDAKPEQYFVLVNGIHLKNIKELVMALESMNDWVFKHHVNESRNDFAEWIGISLGEKRLSDEIKNLKEKHQIEYRMHKYLIQKYL